jgi:hypothetical protein
VVTNVSEEYTALHETIKNDKRNLDNNCSINTKINCLLFTDDQVVIAKKKMSCQKQDMSCRRIMIHVRYK